MLTQRGGGECSEAAFPLDGAIPLLRDLESLLLGAVWG